MRRAHKPLNVARINGHVCCQDLWPGLANHHIVLYPDTNTRIFTEAHFVRWQVQTWLHGQHDARAQRAVVANGCRIVCVQPQPMACTVADMDACQQCSGTDKAFASAGRLRCKQR